MTVLRPFGDQTGDVPEVRCSNCGVIFGIYWHRDGVTSRVEFCPFCGEEVEDGPKKEPR